MVAIPVFPAAIATYDVSAIAKASAAEISGFSSTISNTSGDSLDSSASKGDRDHDHRVRSSRRTPSPNRQRSHIAIIAESILPTVIFGERDAGVLERIALTESRFG
jgi:hypothetical protein